MFFELNFKSAEFALIISAIGVTLSTVVGGSSLLYASSVGLAGAFSLLHIGPTIRAKPKPVIIISVIAAWLMAAALIRYIILVAGGAATIESEVPKIIAIIIILLISVSSSSLTELKFQRSLRVIAVLHIGILIYGILSGDSIASGASLGEPSERFAGAGFKTAAWSEVALGTIMAALLSGNRAIGATGFITGAYSILAADMRTAMIATVAMAFTMLLITLINLKNIHVRMTILIILFSVVIGIYLISSEIITDTIWIGLSLDDPYRGISSGFSNRFDNFRDGWEGFRNAFFLGAGFSDPIVNYTHNGYILTLAQMGAPVGLALFFFLVKAMLQSVQNRNVFLISVIVGLSIFYIGQPRNINFQLCPLIGIIAVGRALLFRYPPKFQKLTQKFM